MLVPEFPGVSAGVLFVGIIEGVARKAGEEIPGGPGVFQQEILRAAGVIDSGAGAARFRWKQLPT